MINFLRSIFGMKPVYKVVKVSDGDTLKTKEIGTVRIRGLDAPELKQKGGLEAKAYLEEILKNSGMKVTMDIHDRDKYGRTLATVYVFGIDIVEIMLSGGQGWRFMDKGKYASQEALAKSKRKGVHAGRQEKPEDYRRRMKRV